MLTRWNSQEHPIRISLHYDRAEAPPRTVIEDLYARQRARDLARKAAQNEAFPMFKAAAFGLLLWASLVVVLLWWVR